MLINNAIQSATVGFEYPTRFPLNLQTDYYAFGAYIYVQSISVQVSYVSFSGLSLEQDGPNIQCVYTTPTNGTRVIKALYVANSDVRNLLGNWVYFMCSFKIPVAITPIDPAITLFIGYTNTLLDTPTQQIYNQYIESTSGLDYTYLYTENKILGELDQTGVLRIFDQCTSPDQSTAECGTLSDVALWINYNGYANEVTYGRYPFTNTYQDNVNNYSPKWTPRSIAHNVRDPTVLGGDLCVGSISPSTDFEDLCMLYLGGVGCGLHGTCRTYAYVRSYPGTPYAAQFEDQVYCYCDQGWTGTTCATANNTIINTTPPPATPPPNTTTPAPIPIVLTVTRTEDVAVDYKSNTPVIIGTVIGGLVFLGLLGLFIYRKWRPRNEEYSPVDFM